MLVVSVKKSKSSKFTVELVGLYVISPRPSKSIPNPSGKSELAASVPNPDTKFPTAPLAIFIPSFSKA